MERERLTNWSGNVVFGAARTHRPTSVQELQRVVAGSSAVRALGTGHSFSRVADTPGDLVQTSALPRTIEVDTEARRVLVGGGVRYGELGRALQAHGMALTNTGSLPHISVAGACATGTHGSGLGNRILAASVRAMTLVGPEGDLVRVDESVGEEWKGWVLALGRLGIVIDLTLDVVPTFLVAQTVVEDVDEQDVAGRVEDVLAASYSVSIFTDWGSPAQVSVWVKERLADGQREQVLPELWGGRPADGPRNPVFGMAADNATQQQGVPGPWNERLPHFRLEFTPSNGDEQQSEYLLPVGDASAAWRALGEVRDAVAPALQVSEVRTIGADDHWLSETGGVDAVGFHFTWVNDDARVAPAVAAVEEALRPFDVRPHWGKVFSTSPSGIAAAYPHLDDFRRLVSRVDPGGVFASEVVDTWLGISR